MPARAAAFVGTVLIALSLTACGQDEKRVVVSPTTTTPSAVERLAHARRQADAATSLHLLITSRDVPGSAEGVLGASTLR